MELRANYTLQVLGGLRGSVMPCCRTVLTAWLSVLILVPSAPSATAEAAAGPRTVSSEVRAACDAAYAVAAKTPGVAIQRRTGTFRDETLRQPVFGCGLAISGSFAR